MKKLFKAVAFVSTTAVAFYAGVVCMALGSALNIFDEDSREETIEKYETLGAILRGREK